MRMTLTARSSPTMSSQHINLIRKNNDIITRVSCQLNWLYYYYYYYYYMAYGYMA